MDVDDDEKDVIVIDKEEEEKTNIISNEGHTYASRAKHGRMVVDQQYATQYDEGYRLLYGDNDIDETEQSKYNEQHAATCLGFLTYSMKFWENEAMKAYESVIEHYVQARNVILNLWMKNMNAYLTVNECKALCLDEFIPLVERIHAYLEQYGHINTGLLSRKERRRSLHTLETKKRRVIVVGAGMAGVTVASQLLAFGHDVEILEARDRNGGRCNTHEANNCCVDLGASLILGFVGNPLATLVRQSGQPVYAMKDECPIYRNTTQLPKAIDDRTYKVFNKMLDGASELRSLVTPTKDHGNAWNSEVPLAPLDKAQVVKLSLREGMEKACQEWRMPPLSTIEQEAYNWHVAHLEYANATDLSKLSLAYWDQDDMYSNFSGDHSYLKNGYGSLVREIVEASNITIHNNVRVTNIEYNNNNNNNGDDDDDDGGGGVRIHDSDGKVWEADLVVVTVPLGVLKSKTIAFDPPFPIEKQASIDRLGFGNLNKVILYFNRVFWGDTDLFGTTRPLERHHGECYMFWNLVRVVGSPCLSVLMAGEAANLVESRTDDEILADVLNVLRMICNDENIPEPIDTCITRWRSDEYARGSYSYVAVGSDGGDYTSIMKPIDNRVYFAGEATNRYMPATVVGAYMSGLKVAGDIEQLGRSYNDDEIIQDISEATQMNHDVGDDGDDGDDRRQFMSSVDFEQAKLRFRKRMQAKMKVGSRLARGLRTTTTTTNKTAEEDRKHMDEVAELLLFGEKPTVKSEYDDAYNDKQKKHTSDVYFNVDMDQAPVKDMRLTLEEKLEMGYVVADLPEVLTYDDDDDGDNTDEEQRRKRKKKKHKKHKKRKKQKRARDNNNGNDAEEENKEAAAEEDNDNNKSRKRKKHKSSKPRMNKKQRHAHAYTINVVKDTLRKVVHSEGCTVSLPVKGAILRKATIKMYKLWKAKNAEKETAPKDFYHKRRRRKVRELVVAYLKKSKDDVASVLNNDDDDDDEDAYNVDEEIALDEHSS